MSNNLDFHPLANQYPLMSDDDLSDLIEDMKLHGYDPRFPIVRYEGKILAGRDRYRAVCRAIKTRKHTDARIEPVYVDLPVGVDPEAFVRRENELRKHFAQEYVETLRNLRRNRVAQMRAQGMSTRQIADKERVSQPTVLNDLNSGDKGLSPDKIDKIQGKDGKSYESNKTLIKCKKCQRKGQCHNCPECARLRGGGKPRGRPREPGDDDDTYGRAGRRAARKAKKEAAQSGSEAFTVKRWDDVLAPVVRMINEIAKAAGWVAGQRETPAHLGIKRKLEEVRTDVIAWQKELTKAARSRN